MRRRVAFGLVLGFAAGCGRVGYAPVRALGDAAREEGPASEAGLDGAPSEGGLDALAGEAGGDVASERALEAPDALDAVAAIDGGDALDGDASVEVSTPDAAPDAPAVEAGCVDGGTLCGAVCADLQVDTAHCGACGVPCVARANREVACVAGRCLDGACREGFGDCNRAAIDGCELDLRSNATHCGACGNDCSLESAEDGLVRGCDAGRCELRSGCIEGFRMNAAGGCDRVSPCEVANGGCGLHANCVLLATMPGLPQQRRCDCHPGWRTPAAATGEGPFCEPNDVRVFGPRLASPGMLTFAFNAYRFASAMGTVLAFTSGADEIVPSDTNGRADGFLVDTTTGTYTQVLGLMDAVPNAPVETIGLSGDARYVVFRSTATNVVPGWFTQSTSQVYLRDRMNGTVNIVTAAASGMGIAGDGESDDLTVSNDGRLVFFSSLATNLVAGDTNNARDVFVRNMETRATRMLSHGAGGEPANADCTDPFSSPDGRYVGYLSRATNLLASGPRPLGGLLLYVTDMMTGETVLASPALGGALPDEDITFAGPFSNDGRKVAFVSAARNLVAGDTNNVADVFLFDRDTRAVTRVSVGDAGQQATLASSLSALSEDGRYVLFLTASPGLVPEDPSPVADAFVRDLRDSRTYLVSHTADGRGLDQPVIAGAIIGRGAYITYLTTATNVTSSRDRFGYAVRAFSGR